MLTYRMLTARDIPAASELLGYDYQVVGERDPEKLGALYLKAREAYATEGCSALLVIVDDYLVEKLEEELDDHSGGSAADLAASFVDQSQHIDPLEVLSSENLSSAGIKVAFEEGYRFNTHAKHVLQLGVSLDDDDAALLLVKLPTPRTYEAFAYVFMGGFNDCPNPAEQTAVCKYWFDTYGAVPAVIGYNSAEFYVENPPTDVAVAKDLAVEMAAFCTDLPFQVFDGFDQIVNNVYNNVQWYFWWD